MEQSKAGDKEQKKLTIQIKGDKMRTDIGEDISSIVGEDGASRMFMHKTKSVRDLDAAKLKSASMKSHRARHLTPHEVKVKRK